MQTLPNRPLLFLLDRKFDTFILIEFTVSNLMRLCWFVMGTWLLIVTIVTAITVTYYSIDNIKWISIAFLNIVLTILYNLYSSGGSISQITSTTTAALPKSVCLSAKLAEKNNSIAFSLPSKFRPRLIFWYCFGK